MAQGRSPGQRINLHASNNSARNKTRHQLFLNNEALITQLAGSLSTVQLFIIQVAAFRGIISMDTS